MFNLLNWFFDNREKTYVLTKELYSDEKIICYYDLYKKLGIVNDIEKMVKQSEFKRYHYSNIQANANTIEKIDNFIRYNLCETENKYSRMYKKNYLMTMASFDSLTWAPKCNDNVKDNVLLLFYQKAQNSEK